MTTIVPLSASLPPLRPLDRGTGTRTHVMAVLNLTPDSFSDGGTLPPLSGPGSRSEDTTGRFASHVASLVAAGATILDVGGQSTRPGAAEVSADEELARILPAIRAIRALPGTLGRTTISVDTYRASVAAAAVAAGADIVNDVSAGRLDPDMLPTVARLGCTVILMHSRGNPTTMGRLNKYPAGGGKGDGLVDAVASELADRVRAAEEAGIRRWRMILDPGLGFAKVGDQNLELLAGLPRLIGDGAGHHILYCMPWLVGPSRKSFVGRAMLGRPGVERRKGSGSGSGDSAATSSDEQYMAESVPAGGAGGAPVEMARPRDRAWGTAATVAAAVAGGADIVRVHDVKEMVQVVRVSDGIWRRG